MLVSQGNNNNPLPSLNESVSFGRFISDSSSLSWDKWSTFSSHNRYVEEAERYAQPGSVAQKKAFFEAHYKRIAAQKAAAAEAAAAAAAAAQIHHTHLAPDHQQSSHVPVTNHAPTVSFEEKPLLQHKCERNRLSSSSTSSKSSAPLIRAAKLFSSPAKPATIIITPNRRRESSNKNNVTPLIKKKSTTNETTERKKWSPRSSLHSKVFQYSSIASATTPRQEPDNNNNKIKPNTPPPARKIESSKVVPATSKVFKTPTRNYWTTPSSMASSSKTAGTKHNHPSKTSTSTSTTTTPCSGSLRTPSAPSASGSKTTGPKWHLLSSVCSKSLSACKNKLQSPTLAMPFSLRTEERATRRKQNLEEKFNSKDAEKLQLQARIKEKAETEFRKFRESFCFRARPLPLFNLLQER